MQTQPKINVHANGCQAQTHSISTPHPHHTCIVVAEVEVPAEPQVYVGVGLHQLHEHMGVGAVVKPGASILDVDIQHGLRGRSALLCCATVPWHSACNVLPVLDWEAACTHETATSAFLGARSLTGRPSTQAASPPATHPDAAAENGRMAEHDDWATL